MNPINQLILIIITTVFFECRPLNQSILIGQLGHSKIEIYLSNLSVDTIELGTFFGFNKNVMFKN